LETEEVFVNDYHAVKTNIIIISVGSKTKNSIGGGTNRLRSAFHPSTQPISVIVALIHQCCVKGGTSWLRSSIPNNPEKEIHNNPLRSRKTELLLRNNKQQLPKKLSLPFCT